MTDTMYSSGIVATSPSHIVWMLYLLVNATGRFYTGVTTDVGRRIRQHNGELTGGAKATRMGRPWRCVKIWGPFDKSTAHHHEHALKRIRGLSRHAWNP